MNQGLPHRATRPLSTEVSTPSQPLSTASQDTPHTPRAVARRPVERDARARKELIETITVAVAYLRAGLPGYALDHLIGRRPRPMRARRMPPPLADDDQHRAVGGEHDG